MSKSGFDIKSVEDFESVKFDTIWIFVSEWQPEGDRWVHRQLRELRKLNDKINSKLIYNNGKVAVIRTGTLNEFNHPDNKLRSYQKLWNDNVKIIDFLKMNVSCNM